MRKLLFTFLFLSFFTASVFAQDVTVYTEKGKFGLQNTSGQIVTNAEFKKLIRLGDNSWIVQKGSKFGLLDNNGEYIISPIYKSAERFPVKFVKFGSNGLYGIFNDKGEVVVEPKYSSADLLYGKMFLIGKNYKYGLAGFDGKIILEPIADDIYMPKPNIIKIKYDGKWYEIEQVKGETMQMPESFSALKNDGNFKVTEFIADPITTTGYGFVSAGDYFIKVFSSISPAYEQTIDELVLNHGADVAGILMKSGWIVKFPFTYARNYYNTVKAPNNGPFSEVKDNLKNKIKSDKKG